MRAIWKDQNNQTLILGILDDIGLMYLCKAHGYGFPYIEDETINDILSGQYMFDDRHFDFWCEI
jgi:hypothetical protein